MRLKIELLVTPKLGEASDIPGRVDEPALGECYKEAGDI